MLQKDNRTESTEDRRRPQKGFRRSFVLWWALALLPVGVALVEGLTSCGGMGKAPCNHARRFLWRVWLNQ